VGIESLELAGVKQLTQELYKLGAAVAAKELRGTARQSMRLVEKRWKAAMPKHPLPHYTYRGRLVGGGFASRNVRIITKINKQTGSVEAVLGVRKEAFYIVQFVERGWSGKAANPTLVPAFAASQSAALQEIADQLRKRLTKAARKKASGGMLPNGRGRT
jgi:hypothetical protein